jgi:hypothetical protein
VRRRDLQDRAGVFAVCAATIIVASVVIWLDCGTIKGPIAQIWSRYADLPLRKSPLRHGPPCLCFFTLKGFSTSQLPSTTPGGSTLHRALTKKNRLSRRTIRPNLPCSTDQDVMSRNETGPCLISRRHTANRFRRRMHEKPRSCFSDCRLAAEFLCALPGLRM